jgi:molybdopterin-guanine dinucleotide biosynthesis protein A
MSGKDKGLIEVFDKPLIEYTINVLKKTGAEIAINANRNQNSYATYGDVFGDTVDERLGPLLGILTSLQYMQTEYVGFVPCDAPMLSLEFIQHLTSRSANSTLTVASDGQFIQPTFSVFHKSMLTPLESFLFSGGRKAGLFMTQQNADVVDCEIYQQCFTNLNTPLDVEQFISTINHSN